MLELITSIAIRRQPSKVGRIVPNAHFSLSLFHCSILSHCEPKRPASMVLLILGHGFADSRDTRLFDVLFDLVASRFYKRNRDVIRITRETTPER
jgi:hypothetical protein